jgi:hypothetical protein
MMDINPEGEGEKGMVFMGLILTEVQRKIARINMTDMVSDRRKERVMDVRDQIKEVEGEKTFVAVILMVV